MGKKHSIAVIGAGNVGQTMAAHLSIAGQEVRLFNRSPDKIRKIKERGGIQLSGVINNFAGINLLTTNIEEAIDGAEIIMVTVPASGHKDIAYYLAPHLKDGQVVILNPGRTGGVFEFRNIFKKLKTTAQVTLAETDSIIYVCRYFECGQVQLSAIKKKIVFATHPVGEEKQIIAVLGPIYPQLRPVPTVLDTSFTNIGAILHPLPTLLNAGWIESPLDQFPYYYRGISPAIASLLERMDNERLSVARAYGINVPSATVWLQSVYSVPGAGLYETIQNNEGYRTVEAPTTLEHRYINEDIPTGLVPLSLLGRLAGVETPLMDLSINLAGNLCNMNFWETGRTLESLGLSECSVEEIIKFASGKEK